MEAFIGKDAPDFVAKTVMPDNSINAHFKLSEYIKNHYTVLFFYPLDFTFVCPSELISLQNNKAEFDRRHVKLVTVSVDSQFSHLAWKKVSYDQGGVGDLQFPMVSDLGGKIARSYGVLNEENVALRATFFMDTTGKIRHISINDSPIGRNIDEILRTIDAFKLHQTTGDVCPAGWRPGKESLQTTSDGVAEYLSKNAGQL